ncbi:MAG: hypothetical protein K1X47_08415 [Cyclobacteriaceae bacterium]|nr:hypothetical protein [Cyclobacteriaceae bacterium]
MTRCSLTFFLVMTLGVAGHAQETGFLEGFVVTNDGDTIPGFIKNKNAVPYRVLQDIKFKKDKDSKPIVYTREQLRGFHAGPNRYVKRVIIEESGERNPYFFEIMIDGPMRLYELHISLMGQGEMVYKILERRDNKEFFSVYGQDFRGRLADFVRDEPSLVDLVQKGRYNRTNFETLVNDYNVMKFDPSHERSRGGPRRTVVFYLNFSKPSQEVFLTFNDSLEYRVLPKFNQPVQMPTDVQTKVCFGTRDTKSCMLLTARPETTSADYYELDANKDADEFSITRVPTIAAQDKIVRVRREP